MEFIIFILILGFLIFIHEFFHFLTAKKSGVLVEEFGFGLPPRIFGKKIGETIYSINLLPFGGFVRLYGEERRIEDKRSFSAQRPKIKTKILLAGVLANFLLAVILFYLVLGAENFEVYLPSIFDQRFLLGKEERYPIIAYVAKNSPAERAGLREYDLIIQANNQKFERGEKFAEFVNQNRGKKIILEVRNLKEKMKREVEIVPRENPPKGEGPLGIKIGLVSYLQYKKISEKIFSGFLHSINVLDYSFRIFGKLVKLSFQKATIEPIAESVTGPVGIFFLVKTTFKEGIIALLGLVALLSLSLGIINLLPIPATDGGRMIFVLYEGLFKRPVPEKFERNFNLAGYFLLLLLLFLITFKDIKQFFLQ
ncbi:MAG: site-2 protease family protein [Candidatus Pacebacteria bacterium]|nr:site-2 protease family protein [Candidatus Paceibacterota bacterium]